MPRIAFLGFGEAACEIAKGLKEEGINDICAFDIAAADPNYGQLIRKRIMDSNVSLKNSVQEVMQEVDFIFSTVVSNAAVAVAEMAAPYLRPEHTYVDLNSTSPKIKQKIEKIIITKSAKFVEAAVMAAVPGNGHKVLLLVCGDGGEQFQLTMSKYGMRISFLGLEVGRASAVKMCRSVIVKGLESLLMESLVAGRVYQVEEEVLQSLNESFPNFDFKKLTKHLMPRTAIHAQRRAHEMEEAAFTIEASGQEAIMSKAAVRKLDWVASLDLKNSFKGIVPSDYQQILNAIEQKFDS